jgi:hypothetical protein
MESLEGRTLLSFILPGDAEFAAAKRGGAKPVGPAIRLDVVALHEFGHSLGLGHDSTDSVVSIMDLYYNAAYSIPDYFLTGQDPAVAELRRLYADVNASSWKDSLDSNPGDSVVEVTFSFVPDGTRMDKASSTLFQTFNTLYGGVPVWQGILTEELGNWSLVSAGKIVFRQIEPDGGQVFNAAGQVQNDPRFGDIRMAAHRFDGAGKTLAHTYLPPPRNSGTGAGDVHFDEAENWDGKRSVAIWARATGQLASSTPFATDQFLSGGKTVFVDGPGNSPGTLEDIFGTDDGLNGELIA